MNVFKSDFFSNEAMNWLRGRTPDWYLVDMGSSPGPTVKIMAKDVCSKIFCQADFIDLASADALGRERNSFTI